MIVKKIALPRRTFLRGTGAALALPLLDAMVPSLTALADTPASPARLRRLGFVYMPMGCDVTRWTPPGGETLDELSPSLSPLAPVKKNIAVISNLELRNAYPGTHATSNASFLSAAKAKRTESTDYYLGTTVDQIAAREIGRDTQLPSLELSMDLLSVVGQCDNGYACVYQNNLSWSSPTTPLPAEAHPRIVFENLFGEEGGAAERRAALEKRASLLDSVVDELTRLQNTLGPGDRNRVNQYLDSVRDVERRIQQAEAAAEENPLPRSRSSARRSGGLCRPRPADVRPAAAGTAGEHHARRHVPTGARNQQSNVSGDRRLRSAPPAHAPRQRPGKDRQGRQDQSIPRLAVRRVFCKSCRPRRKETDRCWTTCSICTAAAWATRTSTTTSTCRSSSPAARPGNMRGGRHIQYKEPTPLANLHLTLLDKVGVRLDSFADSDGKVDELFQPLSI